MLTPLRVRQIFRAKLACCLSLSFVTTAISFGAFTIVASVGDIMLGMSFFLNWSWLVIILLLSPGLMVFGAVFMVFAFNRTSSRIESFQTVAYVALPFLLLYIAPFTGLFRVNATVLLLAARLCGCATFPGSTTGAPSCLKIFKRASKIEKVCCLFIGRNRL
ncbi:MAG: hypothetical protein ACLS8R_08415 [Anaeromassilibacillus sp.]